MKINTFDKISGVIILSSIAYTVITAISWDWFPTPGDWGEIAHIPKSMRNYLALLLPPMETLLYLVVRRRWFKNAPTQHDKR